MATYAIGDIQGCFDELQSLLQLISYDPQKDHLWFAGDLVNRGPKSLDVLRFVKSLDNTVVVLGNHDLHMLAVAHGIEPLKKHDTFMDVLEADDRDELCDWLLQQRIIYHDTTLQFTLVHAGLPPQWSIEEALQHGRELESMLQSKKVDKFFKHMYGNKPSRWKKHLFGWRRLRLITNYLTRLRFCDEKGKLDLNIKSGLGSQPEGFYPWFKVPNRVHKNQKIL